ncbi:MAG TPA: hypothetical protein VJP85_00925 [Candidatus Baltobacteraceae bacterium]|nr:hypothetical protein [Candidatus Baltobacteraceae bacterium]
MIKKSIAFTFVLALAACGHHSDVTTQNAGGNAGASSSGGTTLVAAGTDYYGKLQQPISTKTSHDGDTFALVQTDTLFHKNPALHGAVIDGHLENVRAAGPMRNPALTLVFDDIRMPDGTKAPVDVKLESMKAFEPKTHHLRTLGMMAGGAIAGHEVAKHTGKKHGGLVGAVGGYALSQTLKTDISVPAGTVIEVKFEQPATSGSGGT